jgi:threonine dehydrogenase-like Zn-dependent dehydrogenase
VFDFVGLKTVAEQGLAMLGAGGGLYLVGVAKPEVSLDVNIFERDRRTEACPGRELRLNQLQERHPDVRRTLSAGPDEPGRSCFEKKLHCAT